MNKLVIMVVERYIVEFIGVNGVEKVCVLSLFFDVCVD